MTRALPPLPGPSAGLKIGLFGGSFNPAHEGHLHVAQTALTRLQLDWVWWMVARGNPLKSNHGDFRARLASAHLVANQPRMIVSTFEADAGFTYTVDTLALLKMRSPQARFCWIMGSDSLEQFHDWRDWPTIARLAPICVIARPGYGADARNSIFSRTFAKTRIAENDAPRLPFLSAPAWTYLKAPLNPISSTAIRKSKPTP